MTVNINLCRLSKKSIRYYRREIKKNQLVARLFVDWGRKETGLPRAVYYKYSRHFFKKVIKHLLRLSPNNTEILGHHFGYLYNPVCIDRNYLVDVVDGQLIRNQPELITVSDD